MKDFLKERIRKTMKKRLILLLSLAAAFLPATTSFAADMKPTVPISLDGTNISGEAGQTGDTLMIPLRAVAEAEGYSVTWSGSDRKITLSRSSRSVVLDLAENKVQDGTHSSFLTDSPLLLDGRTYLASGFFSEHLGLRTSTVSTGGKLELKTLPESPITLENLQIRSQSPTLTVDIQYPGIRGMANAQAQESLNALFLGKATACREKGLKSEKDEAEVEKAFPDRKMAMQSYFNYSVKRNGNGLVSIVSDDYQFSGGAHGSTLQTSCTFDPATGTVFDIGDLFNENADFITLISDRISKQMKEQDRGNTLVSFRAIQAKQDYYLENDTLVIYFQQYEYYPYAYGIPEFSIPLSDFGNALKERFIRN